MSSHVLDSSAILAVLNVEQGANMAIKYFAHSRVNTVNVAEVLTKLIERGQDVASATRAFNLLQLEVIDFDIEQARKAAELRPVTRHLGLSLGDRSCLALAILQGATAVTADREWKRISFCSVKVIR